MRDTTFNLKEAALIADTTVPALRTRIARQTLRYIGHRPLAGDERRFNIAGLYEVALVDELTNNHLAQAAAAQVVSELFDSEIRTSAYQYLKAHPDIEFSDEVLGRVADDLDCWLWPGALGDRDLSRPRLVVFAFPSDQATPAIRGVNGFHKVGKAMIELQRDIVFGRTTPELAREYKKAVSEGRPMISDVTALNESGIPVIHILNITAVLARVDERIADVLKSRVEAVT